MDHMQQDELAEFDVTVDEFDAMLAESERVEVGGPPDSARRVTFELVRGGLDAYRWRLVAENGQILATSATSYRSRDDVRRVLAGLAAAIQTAPVVEAAEISDQRRAS